MWRDYCMLSALLKYRPLILCPRVWLSILSSGLKHVPCSRYAATEPDCRSPPVPPVLRFQQSCRFLSAHQALHIHVGWYVQNVSVISLCCWTTSGFSRVISLKMMLQAQVLRAFVNSVLCAAAVTQRWDCPRGNSKTLLKVFCAPLLKKLS